MLPYLCWVEQNVFRSPIAGGLACVCYCSDRAVEAGRSCTGGHKATAHCTACSTRRHWGSIQCTGEGWGDHELRAAVLMHPGGSSSCKLFICTQLGQCSSTISQDTKMLPGSCSACLCTLQAARVLACNSLSIFTMPAVQQGFPGTQQRRR